MTYLFNSILMLRLRWLGPLVASLLFGLLVSQSGFAAPLPASFGVGMQVLQHKGMAITVIYPTLANEGKHTFGPFELKVALNGKPVPGNHRLVVLSHGTGGNPMADYDLARDFAKLGFVVAQPTHKGDNYLDTSKSGPSAWETRPAEISQAIDLIATHPDFGPIVDTKRVGVHGISAGGATAIAMAGAGWRMLHMVRHCNAHWDEDLGFCGNGLASQPQALNDRRARMERARYAPFEFLLPAELTDWHGSKPIDVADGLPADTRPDKRVQSVTVSVPLVAIYSADSLKAISIPLGVVEAQADEVLAPQFHSSFLLTHCKTCARLVRLAGAGHFDVLGPWPESVATQVASQQIRGGKQSGQVTPQQRQQARAAIVQFHQYRLQ